MRRRQENYEQEAVSTAEAETAVLNTSFFSFLLSFFLSFFLLILLFRRIHTRLISRSRRRLVTLLPPPRRPKSPEAVARAVLLSSLWSSLSIVNNFA